MTKRSSKRYTREYLRAGNVTWGFPLKGTGLCGSLQFTADDRLAISHGFNGNLLNLDLTAAKDLAIQIGRALRTWKKTTKPALRWYRCRDIIRSYPDRKVYFPRGESWPTCPEEMCQEFKDKRISQKVALAQIALWKKARAK